MYVCTVTYIYVCMYVCTVIYIYNYTVSVLFFWGSILPWRLIWSIPLSIVGMLLANISVWFLVIYYIAKIHNVMVMPFCLWILQSVCVCIYIPICDLKVSCSLLKNQVVDVNITNLDGHDSWHHSWWSTPNCLWFFNPNFSKFRSHFLLNFQSDFLEHHMEIILYPSKTHRFN